MRWLWGRAAAAAARRRRRSCRRHSLQCHALLSLRRLEKCASLLSRKDLAAVKRRYQQLEVRLMGAPERELAAAAAAAGPAACTQPGAAAALRSTAPHPSHRPPPTAATAGRPQGD